MEVMYGSPYPVSYTHLLINMNHSITNISNNMEIVELNNNKNDIIQLEKLYIPS